MSKVTVKHRNKTTYVGPGGWNNCPCCILMHYRNRKFRKKYTARVQRRIKRWEEDYSIRGGELFPSQIRSYND